MCARPAAVFRSGARRPGAFRTGLAAAFRVVATDFAGLAGLFGFACFAGFVGLLGDAGLTTVARFG
jgi:hypothetical protein